MSQQNVEIVQRVYAPYAEGRLDFEFIDPEIEWRGPREFPDLGEAHHGHEGITRYFAKIAEAFDEYRMVPERFIDAGNDRVLVLSREGGRGKGSGAEVQTHLTAHVWTLKDGKAVRMRSYWERADALEAVELSEQDAYADSSESANA